MTATAAAESGTKTSEPDARLVMMNRDARRVVETLPDRERAIMLMRGTFGGRPRALADVGRAFGVHYMHVLEVEAKVFRMLGKEWLAEWDAERHATQHLRRAPWKRIRDFDYVDRISYRARSVPRPRQPRGCNLRRKGSRRRAGTRITSRGDPDDLGDKPPGSRRLSIGGRR